MSSPLTLNAPPHFIPFSPVHELMEDSHMGEVSGSIHQALKIMQHCCPELTFTLCLSSIKARFAHISVQFFVKKQVLKADKKVSVSSQS